MCENRHFRPSAPGPLSAADFLLVCERMEKDRDLAQGFLALSIAGALAGAVLAAAIKQPVLWWARWEPMLAYSLAGTSFLLSTGYSLRISLLQDKLRSLRRNIRVA